jgi:hypothetical protein
VTRTFDSAVDELYQVALGEFVAVRKRLAAELKAAGDKVGAAGLAKLARPTVSAWVVDQLHWRHRAEMDAMFESAARLRRGELDATAAHRDALAALRVRAGEVLHEGGHGATEATVRRIMTTVSALAAAGGWAPDRPGALAEDRDPPGFEGVGVIAARGAGVPALASAPARDERDDRAEAAAREARERAAREARAAEQKRRRAERERLTFQLTAARATVAELERQLAALGRDDDDE